jgi:CHAT domain-containing protein
MADFRLAKGTLAVLSACETGVISERLPDEVLSLSSGILQSGASAVVSSLWSVPDVSTTILMARFYFLCSEQRVPPAAALREAQRWLRDSTDGVVASFLRARFPAGDGRPDRRARRDGVGVVVRTLRALGSIPYVGR